MGREAMQRKSAESECFDPGAPRATEHAEDQRGDKERDETPVPLQAGPLVDVLRARRMAWWCTTDRTK